MLAEERTEIAKEDLESLTNLLKHTLSVNDKIEWETLKRTDSFNKPIPSNSFKQKSALISKPEKPILLTPPSKPEESAFLPSIGLIDRLFSSRKQNKIQSSQKQFDEAQLFWESECKRIENKNRQSLSEYEFSLEEYKQKIARLKNLLQEEDNFWTEEKVLFDKEKQEYNNKIDQLREEYFKFNPDAVIEHFELVLNGSDYPDYFPRDFNIEYTPDSKMLYIDYSLPSLDSLPTLTEVKYIATKKELKESHLSSTALNNLYDHVIYCICLRTIHELYEADEANSIESVVFNGWVNVLNKSIGKKSNTCIVSIHVKKSEFSEIDLEHVDPKLCFKSLKGVSASKISSITAIQPIVQLSKKDKRFIQGSDVLDSLQDEANLASMPWEDFEHLLREIFQKEFSSNGGEVKVTQASRDGGVDAIAFDPDPIRGGKIVIQAKRYTNTVGVAAVRDLYGTVMNEGATKGILVTTSDYGPDAYEFVRNKPLTLMNGSNLLYLLENHGRKFKIDLQEAKKLYK